MITESRTVEISADAYSWACRGAALDRVDVATYLEVLVKCDAERIRTGEFLEREGVVDALLCHAPRAAARGMRSL